MSTAERHKLEAALLDVRSRASVLLRWYEEHLTTEEARCLLQLLRCLDRRSRAGCVSAFEATDRRRGKVRGLTTPESKPCYRVW
jgi:hypothetical protein